MILDVEETFIVGQDTYLDSMSPANSFGVTFEDDLTTGYFYAVDTKPDLQILDALHIYNVDSVADEEKPSKLQITWTDDGQIAFLLMNDYCHAIFDFKEKAGYCRNGFPASNKNWAQIQTRILTDELIDVLFGSKK